MASVKLEEGQDSEFTKSFKLQKVIENFEAIDSEIFQDER